MYLRLQNEATVVAINAHGNRTNGQLLAQNAHMERQDQQAFKQQEASSRPTSQRRLTPSLER